MRKFSIVIIILFFLVGSALLWWKAENQPVNVGDTTQKVFVVHRGESIRDIATHLQQASLIRNSIAFFLLVKEKGYEGKIQAGDFRLSPSMDLNTLAQALTHGTLDVWITIPEGLRAEEIAAIFQSKFSQYDDTWKAALTQHQGYLFPDTYLFPSDITTFATIQDKLLTTFDAKYQQLLSSQTTPYTKTQIVTIASLIEREAKFQDDRPLVASVIYNRLKQNMPLQIDSTIQYALGYQSQEKTWWKKNVTIDDLKIVSPYNTYTNTGLPPKPISNPGLSALQAATKPTQTDYLYYVSDKSGHLHFADTLDQHNANIIKYGVQ